MMTAMTKGGQRLRLEEARGEHGSALPLSFDFSSLVWARNGSAKRARPTKTRGIVERAHLGQIGGIAERARPGKSGGIATQAREISPSTLLPFYATG